MKSLDRLIGYPSNLQEDIAMEHMHQQAEALSAEWTALMKPSVKTLGENPYVFIIP
jgi:hypothetical protein